MTVYYQSVDTREFFFSTDHIQCLRKLQNIPKHFVPISQYDWSIKRVRRFLQSFGDMEIKNPDPNFQPKEE